MLIESKMEIEKFVSYRKRLGLTQKELAQLLVTSLKAIHSYEQGWRNIPDNVERQLLFLISGREKSACSPNPVGALKNALLKEKSSARPGSLKPAIYLVYQRDHL